MADAKKTLKVAGFHAENVKRVKMVDMDITTDNGLVIIGGKNEQGKSSVLDSLMYALGGGKCVPPMPIYEGAEKGEVSVRLKGESAEYLVKRTFTGKGTYLSVETPNGATFKSPQALLDGFLGELSFDPLAFGSLPPTEQREVILDLSGKRAELLANEAEIAETYEERRDIGRDVKTLKGKLDGEDMPDGPDEEVDQAEILSRLRAARREKEAADAVRREYEAAQREVEDAGEAVTRQEMVIADLEAQMKRAKEELKYSKKAYADTQKTSAELEETVGTLNEPGIEALEAELEKVEDVNRVVRERERIKGIKGEYEQRKAAFDKTEKRLEKLRRERQKAIESADMPIEGLSVSEDGIELNGKPWVQLSSSERLKASVAIAMRKNPNLRVIRVEDGSLLDNDSMKLLAKMAEENDFHIWVERVGEDDTMTVVIRNGEVV